MPEYITEDNRIYEIRKREVSIERLKEEIANIEADITQLKTAPDRETLAFYNERIEADNAVKLEMLAKKKELLKTLLNL